MNHLYVLCVGFIRRVFVACACVRRCVLCVVGLCQLTSAVVSKLQVIFPLLAEGVTRLMIWSCGFYRPEAL